MSLFRTTEENFEFFTIETHPSQSFSSSSAGITGSVTLYPRVNLVEKDFVEENFIFKTLSPFKDNTLAARLRGIRKGYNPNAINGFQDAINSYFIAVNDSGLGYKRSKTVQIRRSVPSGTFPGELVKTNLMKHYVVENPTYDWGYTNYNCLNFFSSSDPRLPNNSALAYLSSGTNNYYAPSGPFTLDFFIKPTQGNTKRLDQYAPSTIFHLYDGITLSIISGSSRDEQGLVNGYNFLLQLSQSANIHPADAVPGGYPRDLIFTSKDNSLMKDEWHHVSIKWGTNSINNGSGSFLVNGKNCGDFVIPSSSIGSHLSSSQIIFIGNFYSGTQDPIGFFNFETNRDHGVPDMGGSQVTSYVFDNIANCELHDIKLYNTYKSNNEILSNLNSSPGVPIPNDILFWVPPLYTSESLERNVFNTPFLSSSNVKTSHPFNVEYSFRLSGLQINIENFTRDFSRSIYPLPINLTQSLLYGWDKSAATNEITYATGSLIRRNLLIFPCDDGNYVPNFNLLDSGTMNINNDQFKNFLDSKDLSFISLRSMVSNSLNLKDLTGAGQSFDEMVKPGLTNPDSQELSKEYYITTMYGDNDSREVSFFNISNLFYGNRIYPNSFKVVDSSFTGSFGRQSVTLRDDGNGNIYRHDCKTTPAKWNSVGNVFYNEGIIVIKSPHLSFFGKDQFEMDLNGDRNVHVFKVQVVAPAGMVNSSSNPNYKTISASLNANDNDTDFVYVTNIDFMDKDLNVIMRSSFAQPVLKRFGDKILFKASMDF